ncbi:MAG: (2Fe-2S)-binding protein [Candidatus Hodarchaeales archaeon]|jgi:aerobic-type carbon monoxide dehydrogenase small subunit (CoxS/CutS family)
MIIPVTINGVQRELNVKNGCSEGNCGSCVILVDNIPRKSCLMLIGQVINREITTIEGLGTAEEPHPLQDAFELQRNHILSKTHLWRKQAFNADFAFRG